MQEGRNIDHKLSFDASSDRDKVELVKDIVAIANSGGGTIVFGKSDDKSIGVSEAVIEALDSAKCADFVEKYCDAQVHLSHDIDKITSDSFIFTLRIPVSPVLITMSRDGTWRGSDPKKDRPLFFKGDIWVRHSSKTERISNQDVREWIEKVRDEESKRIINIISSLSALGDVSKLVEFGS